MAKNPTARTVRARRPGSTAPTLRPAAVRPKAVDTDALPTEIAVATPPPGPTAAELAARLTAAWSDVTEAPADPGETVRTALSGAHSAPDGVFPRPRMVGEALRGIAADPGSDYEIGAVVGQGGMGVVKRARQTALGRIIAVKVLRGEHCDRPEVRAHFLSEAAVTAELDHPGIVPVHDLGSDAAGRPFYAMKLVKGVPWSQVIDERGLAGNLEILLKVCDAVAYAHSKGVIHRDLKPDNVMVGEFGEVLVLDWGLAAAVTPGSRARRLDEGSRISGTPSYMAPEMAIGDLERIGIPSDIYLLGGLLYRIISGHAPHPGAETRRVVMAAARNEIPAASEGGELLSIAMHALDSDPTRRHQSVAELQADLRGYQEHRESIALGRAAGEDLERATSSNSYDDFASAVSAFREALRLWDGNAVAQVGLESARLAYARLAYSRGDFDLAESMLDAPHQEERGLLSQVRSARALRINRRRRMRGLRIAAGALAACLLLALAGGAMFALRAGNAERERDHQKLRALESDLAAKQIEAEAAARVRRRAQAFVPYSHGVDLLMRGQAHLAEATSELRAALAIDDGFAEAHFALGECLRLSGRPHLAIDPYLRSDELTRAGSAKPNSQALVLAGLACLEAFDIRRIPAILGTFDGTTPDDPLAMIGQVLSLTDQRRMAEALPLAQKLVTRAPLLWESHCAFGITAFWAVNEGLADPREVLLPSITALRRAYELSPRQPIVRIFLVRALRRADRPEDRALLATLNANGDTGDEHPVLRVDRVLSLAGSGQLDEARRQLDQARKDGGPPAVLGYGEAAITRIQDPARGFDLIGKVITDFGPNPPLIAKWIAMGVRLPAKRAEAEAFFTRWQGEQTTQPSRYVAAVAIALAKGDEAVAARELAAGLKLAPFSPELLLARLDILRRGKKWDALLETVRPLIAGQPRNFELRLVELEALAGSGNLALGMERFAALEADFPERAADVVKVRARLMQGLSRP